MKRSIRIILAAALIIIGAMDAMAIEEAAYNVVKRDDIFEIHDYAPHILAETIVEGDLEQIGNTAFRRLFRYISGDKLSRDKLAMTTPVSQEPKREKIKMTAPVGQQRIQDRWAVSFMMPAKYTLETLPKPEDPLITLRQVASRRMTAVRDSGFWSEKNYLRYRITLESWIRESGLWIAHVMGHRDTDMIIRVYAKFVKSAANRDGQALNDIHNRMISNNN